MSLLATASCSDRQARERPPPSPLETAIARDLTARFATPVTVRCVVVTVVPLSCTATLGNGTELPIAIEHHKTEWGWHVDGVVIEAAAIVAYVEDGLASIHVQQAVDCGPPVQVIPRGDRIVCKLAGGGAAFVSLAPDGTASLELALDPAAAAARTELVTADKDRELGRQSSELETTAGESDGEEAVGDAGVTGEDEAGSDAGAR